MNAATPPPSDRTLSLVRGYHDATTPPAEVAGLGLGQRFAVVLDTARRDRADMYFDADLYLCLVPALCATIGCDRLQIHLADGRRLAGFDALAAAWAGLPEEDREIPERVELERDGRVACLVVTEYWTAVGGPPPYHDSYTLSFYTADDRWDALRRASEQAAAGAGAVITGCHVGRQERQPARPPWRALLDWLSHGRGW